MQLYIDHNHVCCACLVQRGHVTMLERQFHKLWQKGLVNLLLQVTAGVCIIIICRTSRNSNKVFLPNTQSDLQQI